MFLDPKKKNIETLQSLRKKGFKFEEKIKNVDSKLSGKTFVLTGTLQQSNRQEAVNLIEKKGGSVTTSISKNTDYLVAGENPGSKFQKATSLGVPVMTEKELIDLLS